MSALIQQVGQVLARAHSLFGDPPTSGASAAVGAGADLAGGREMVASGQQQISTLSGQFADSYGVFAADAGSALRDLPGSDGKLGRQLEQAAAADRSGRAASRAVINGADADVVALSPLAHTPAGEKALLGALRARVAQAQNLIEDGKARDAQIAAQLRSLAYQPDDRDTGPDDQILGDATQNPMAKPAGFGTGAMPEGPAPHKVIDPDNPFVGDERFGHWEDYSPPPYVGATPPPPIGHRSLEGEPAKEGGPSGFYTPGRTWIQDSSAPWASVSEQYKFRISGEDLTSYTRTVTIDGHPQLQRWVGYTYEAQRTTQVDLSGSLWAKTDPDELQGTPGGTTTGGLGGLVIPPKFGEWQPITPNQMSYLSTLNPDVTYYIPDGCGGQFTFVGGQPIGGGFLAPPPSVPQMTKPR